MAKNILLLRLERIFGAGLWQYRDELGTVWRLMSESLRFNRFYAATPSVDMPIGGASPRGVMPSGTGGAVDTASSCPVPCADRRQNLLSECVRRGYKGMVFGSSSRSRAHRFVDDAWHVAGDPDAARLHEEALSGMAAAQKAGRPFIAYFGRGGLSPADSAPGGGHSEKAAERLRAACSRIDASLNRLLNGMAALGLLDEIIIMAFGEPGGETSPHGLGWRCRHDGMPYADVVRTPMFVHAPGLFSPAVTGRLASSDDICPTARGLLFSDNPPSAGCAEYSGIDLFREKREFVCSRDVVVPQRECGARGKATAGGYAVTDGDYRLLASFGGGGGGAGRGGMALYCDQADPSGSLNLLDFFELDEEGGIKAFSPPPEAVAKHFASVFGPPQVESLIAVYGRLRRKLGEFMNAGEQTVLTAQGARKDEGGNHE